jgi:hypothetical protein
VEGNDEGFGLTLSMSVAYYAKIVGIEILPKQSAKSALRGMTTTFKGRMKARSIGYNLSPRV